MDIRQKCCELAEDFELIFLEGFDSAILGISQRLNEPTVVVYSRERILRAMMKNGSDYEEAVESYYFNIERSNAGPRAPIIVQSLIDL